MSSWAALSGCSMAVQNTNSHLKYYPSCTSGNSVGLWTDSRGHAHLPVSSRREMVQWYSTMMHYALNGVVGPPSSPSPPPPPPTIMLVGSATSSLVSANYPTSNLIDGNTLTLTTTQRVTQSNPQWASVRLEEPSHVRGVIIYSRSDMRRPLPTYHSLYRLSPYSIWLGTYYGDRSYPCAQHVIVDEALGQFTTPCNAAARFQYVTVLLEADGEVARWLSISEVCVF